LRYRVGAVEEEDGDLLVRLIAHIYRTVNALRRLLPLYLSGPDFDAMTLASITILYQESVSSQYDGNPAHGVVVPRHSFSRRQTQPANQSSSALKKNLVGHFSCPLLARSLE
jgi:hypothetical protein